MSEASVGEALSKPILVAGRVPEHAPDDFRVRVRQRPGDRFPDNVGDFGGLVEEDEESLAFVVESLEGGGVILGTGNSVCPGGKEPIE
jgi:hypothetical protein